jgi:hypothetical protein
LLCSNREARCPVARDAVGSCGRVYDHVRHMKPLNAFEALGPAYRRTITVLGQPFGLGTFLKITLVAALAEIGCMSLAVSLPIQVVQLVAQFSVLTTKNSLPRATSLGMLIGVLIFMSMFAALYLLLAYVFIRLRFVVFEFIVTPSKRVADAWRKHARTSLRFFWVNLLIMLALGLVVVVAVGPLILHSFRMAMATPHNPKALLPSFFLMFGVITLLTFAVHGLDSMVRDFVLPPMALEDASIEGAFGRFFQMLGQEPGEVILFLLVKLAITVAITLALMIGVILVLLLLAGVLVGVGTALYALLWHLGMGGQMLVVIYGALAAAGFLTLYLGSIFSVNGASGLFRSAYGVYFFAGRYPVLGDRLEPPPAVVESIAPPQTAPTLMPLSEPPLW